MPEEGYIISREAVATLLNRERFVECPDTGSWLSNAIVGNYLALEHSP